MKYEMPKFMETVGLIDQKKQCLLSKCSVSIRCPYCKYALGRMTPASAPHYGDAPSKTSTIRTVKCPGYKPLNYVNGFAAFSLQQARLQLIDMQFPV